jgi:hypothetical protein
MQVKASSLRFLAALFLIDSITKLSRSECRALGSGVVAWEGPSPLDGKPIALIVTGISTPSSNSKTGEMLQTWILRADINPADAVRLGCDVSVCGNCPNRPLFQGACYVRTPDAPFSVWMAYRNGKYPKADISLLKALGRSFKVRAGSYGDPAMVPTSVWEAINPWTGYTHQWHQSWIDPSLKRWIMASTDSSVETSRAIAAGWRVFQATSQDDVPPNSVRCPADVRDDVTCHKCGLCKGTRLTAKSVWIPVHGATAKRHNGPQIPSPKDGKLLILQ